MNALNTALEQQFFPASTKEVVLVFLQRQVVEVPDDDSVLLVR